MKLNRLPTLVLAIGLQILPICRLACVNDTGPRAGFAILMKWVGGAGVLLGGLDAMSGASPTILGVYNTNPIGIPSLVATGAVTHPFSYKIYVANAGINPETATYNAAPLPPGLTINTAPGGDGVIFGTPTEAGTNFPITLTAGNTLYAGLITTNIKIIIWAPPNITAPPTDQTAAVGGEASFSVTAAGSGPFTYKWQYAGTNIAKATNTTLHLTNLLASDFGRYTAVVSGPGGPASASANLSVATVEVPIVLSNPQWVNDRLEFDVSGPSQTNFVVLCLTDLSQSNWTSLQTNASGTGSVHCICTNCPPGVGYIRVALGP
jgi:hypothetical protein